MRIISLLCLSFSLSLAQEKADFTSQIFYRFYLIKRLGPAVECIKKKKITKKGIQQEVENLLHDWKDFCSYHDIGQETYEHYIAESIYLACMDCMGDCKNLPLNTLKINKKKESLVYQLLQVYEIIEAIPMHEVLDAVDFIALALKEVLKEEKTKEQVQAKKTRLYWMVNLSVLLGGIAFKVFNHYRLYYVIYDYFTASKLPNKQIASSHCL